MTLPPTSPHSTRRDQTPLDHTHTHTRREILACGRTFPRDDRTRAHAIITSRNCSGWHASGTEAYHPYDRDPGPLRPYFPYLPTFIYRALLRLSVIYRCVVCAGTSVTRSSWRSWQLVSWSIGSTEYIGYGSRNVRLVVGSVSYRPYTQFVPFYARSIDVNLLPVFGAPQYLRWLL